MGHLEKEDFHQDSVYREELIRAYLLKQIDAETAEAFESHYLSCDDCFEELIASQQLMLGIGGRRVELRRVDDVLILQFAGPAQLIRQSVELEELKRAFQQKDSKVLIDLGRVSKIDSAGLGLLMSCYSHAVRNQGMLKLLHPNTGVKTLLRLTKIDSLLEAYDDQNLALRSFRTRDEEA